MNDNIYINNHIVDNFNIEEKKDNNNNKKSSESSLPFLRVNIEKISDLNNLSKKVEKSKTLINSQTDKLLIAGFEGDEDDFKQCYKIIEPIKIKKISNIKQKKLNKFLVKDDYFGPIKLTKIKEFNMTLRQKNKLLEKIHQFKTIKKTNINYNKYYKENKNIINNIINNTSKYNNNSINNINGSISGNNMLYNNSSSSNNIFNNSTTNNFYNNSLNSLKGSYFFYKSNNQSRTPHHLKRSHSISQNNFVTLRDILTNTSHNINHINDNLKKYIKNNKDIYSNSYSENSNKSKTIKINNKNKKSNLYEILDSIKKKDKDQILKQIKKDEGTNSQNIWIKKSTANLISFGKAFLYLADDLFFRERKRIVDNYPKLEKEADLPVVEKNDKDLLKKMHKVKMEKNSRVMKDLNYNNNLLVKKLSKRMKKSKSEDMYNN